MTIFPVTGSFCLHRLIGFANTHVAHCLSCSLLKRKVSLSSHSTLLSVGEVVSSADTLGDSVGSKVVGTDVSFLGPADGSDVVGDDVVLDNVGLLVGFFVVVRAGK